MGEVQWALCTANMSLGHAAPAATDPGTLALGVVLALLSDISLALSMAIQRYALSYPSYQVKVLCTHLYRPVVWTLGFLCYCCANGFFAVSSTMTPRVVTHDAVCGHP